MATWVAVIAETKGRADFWDAAAKLGVRAVRPLRRYVLIDCGAQFGRVCRFGQDLSRALAIETIAFIAQTTADVHCVWTFRAGNLVRELEYNRDEGGWQKIAGTPQPWEHDYCAGEKLEDVQPSSTANLFEVCKRYGVEDAIADAEWTPPRRGLLAWLGRRLRSART
jgi:hypothetical protein